MDREREDLSIDVDALYIRLEAEIEAGIDRVPVDENPADEDSADGDSADRNLMDGESAHGNSLDRNLADGDSTDGESADPNSADSVHRDRMKATPVGAEPEKTEARSKSEILAALQQRAEACRACPLHEHRDKLVFGAGDPDCRLMFVGEAPGKDEDRAGIPFVGRAGQLLTRMIEAMGYTRETVYIANVIKCHPRGNRTPAPREIESCRGFLESQIRTLAPTVIVALGAPASKTLLRREEGITTLRGHLFPYPDDPSITIVPTFHPAYLLRNESEKGKVWQDLQKAMALLEKV